jgi:tetratricopeptide (TPR) repeat protein
MVVLTAPYWWTRGSPNEGDELITSVLALPLGEGLARHGRVLDTASAMATLRGDFDRAAELGGEAVRVLEEAGDLQSLGVALSNLGGSFAFQPDRLDESIDHLRRAIDVFRSLGQLERLASAMLNLANAYLGLYRYADAEATYREARDIAEACGDARWVASATLGVGECAYWSGDLATARVTLLAAAEDGAALHDYAIVVNALDPLAIVASRSSAHEEALLVRVAVDAAASRLGHALDPLYEDARNAAADASRETLGAAAAEVEARAASLALDDVLAVVRQGSERSAAKPARRA